MTIDDPALRIYGPGDPAPLLDRRDVFGDKAVARAVRQKMKKGHRSQKIAKELDVPVEWVAEVRKMKTDPTKEEREEIEKRGKKK